MNQPYLVILIFGNPQYRSFLDTLNFISESGNFMSKIFYYYCGANGNFRAIFYLLTLYFLNDIIIKTTWKIHMKYFCAKLAKTPKHFFAFPEPLKFGFWPQTWINTPPMHHYIVDTIVFLSLDQNLHLHPPTLLKSPNNIATNTEQTIKQIVNDIHKHRNHTPIADRNKHGANATCTCLFLFGIEKYSVRSISKQLSTCCVKKGSITLSA